MAVGEQTHVISSSNTEATHVISKLVDSKLPSLQIYVYFHCSRASQSDESAHRSRKQWGHANEAVSLIPIGTSAIAQHVDDDFDVSDSESDDDEVEVDAPAAEASVDTPLPSVVTKEDETVVVTSSAQALVTVISAPAEPAAEATSGEKEQEVRVCGFVCDFFLC